MSRARFRIGRLNHLLEQLAALPDYSGSGLPTNIRDLGSIGSPEYQGKLKRFHTEVLDALATAAPETELAYQLGRSIRDTVKPPAGPQDPRAPALASQLARGRIAQIQEWLAALSAHLPPHTAAIVGASMGRWSELAAVTMDTQATALKKTRNGGEEQFARDMCAWRQAASAGRRLADDQPRQPLTRGLPPLGAAAGGGRADGYSVGR